MKEKFVLIYFKTVKAKKVWQTKRNARLNKLNSYHNKVVIANLCSLERSLFGCMITYFVLLYMLLIRGTCKYSFTNYANEILIHSLK